MSSCFQCCFFDQQFCATLEWSFNVRALCIGKKKTVFGYFVVCFEHFVVGQESGSFVLALKNALPNLKYPQSTYLARMKVFRPYSKLHFRLVLSSTDEKNVATSIQHLSCTPVLSSNVLGLLRQARENSADRSCLGRKCNSDEFAYPFA